MEPPAEPEPAFGEPIESDSVAIGGQDPSRIEDEFITEGLGDDDTLVTKDDDETSDDDEESVDDDFGSDDFRGFGDDDDEDREDF